MAVFGHIRPYMLAYHRNKSFGEVWFWSLWRQNATFSITPDQSQRLFTSVEFDTIWPYSVILGRICSHTTGISHLEKYAFGHYVAEMPSLQYLCVLDYYRRSFMPVQFDTIWTYSVIFGRICSHTTGISHLEKYGFGHYVAKMPLSQ